MSGNTSSANAEPNLTPILDMVFQLITFFMLVINFKAGEVDRRLSLPVVGSARPVSADPGRDVLVLNVAADGKLLVYGEPTNAGAYIQAEAQAALLKAGLDSNAVAEGKIDLPTTVVLRADKRLRFAELNQVLTACRKHGFRQFAMRSGLPDPQ